MPTKLRRHGDLLFDSPRLLLTLVSLFWSGNVVLGRFIAGHVPPATLSCIRWLGAALFMFAFAWPHLRRDWKTIRKNSGLLTIISLIGISTYTLMSYYSLQYTEAINALLIISTGPLLVAAVTFIMYGEKPTARQIVGVIASLAGVTVVISRGDPDVLLHLKLNKGDIWFFLAQIVYAFYTVLLRKRPAIHSLSFAFVLAAVGGLILVPLMLAEMAAGQYPVWDGPALATLAYVTLLPSLVAYLFYNRGVELLGPNRAAPFYHLIPIFGSALAILFLGERPYLYHAVGYGLVLIGIVIATATTGKRAAFRTSAVSPAGPAVAPVPQPAPKPARRHQPRSRQ
ncbi:MAG TPA: DMT family transporter [Xanthobacteraceae bacterium]|jgi:drug/metabolite transporter (DMT)-like permease|nr:DMT family transporter [Xanthobacteraceae bacterium]